MRLRYTKTDGSVTELPLGSRVVTIGRNPDSDVLLVDDRVSRIHCAIRQGDEGFQLKDLKSRNGTFVNGERIESVTLKAGDQIRVGQQVLVVDDEKGADTAMHELNQQMAGGKGYTTILREIAPESSIRVPVVPVVPVETPPSDPAPARAPAAGTPTRKAPRIVLKKKPSAE